MGFEALSKAEHPGSSSIQYYISMVPFLLGKIPATCCFRGNNKVWGTASKVPEPVICRLLHA